MIKKRDRRSAAKHRAILKAAAAVVSEAGYNGAKIEHIAVRAGVGKQTIYRRWPSKAHLLTEVYTSLVPRRRLTVAAGSPAVELQHLLTESFRLYRETPAASILAGLIADVQTQGDAADSLRETLINGRRNLITGPLQRAIGENLLPGDFDVAWAADQIVALIWHRLLSDRKKLTDDFAREMVDKIIGKTLSGRRLSITDYTPGALGTVCEMQTTYHAERRNFGRAFETKIAGEMAEFLAGFNPDQNLFKLAKVDGEIVGSITIDGQNPDHAHLRWFFVGDDLRGLGVGSQLLSTALAFVRSKEFSTVFLTTIDGLDAARHLYEKAGFDLVEERSGDSWGKEVIEQRFELVI